MTTSDKQRCRSTSVLHTQIAEGMRGKRESDGSTYYYRCLSPMASHCCANDTFITFYRFFTLNVNLRPFIVAQRPTATTILFVSNAHTGDAYLIPSIVRFLRLPFVFFFSFFPIQTYLRECAEDAAGFAQAQPQPQSQTQPQPGSIMLPTNRHMSRCTNTNTHRLCVYLSVCPCACVLLLLLLFVCWVCLGRMARIRNVAHTQQGKLSAALEYCNKSQMPDMNNF